jgi:hypothetical protein
MDHTIAIRQTIDQYLNQLSLERLNFVADFLAYLADRENDKATQELLDIPGFMESFQKGEKDIEEGRLVDWRTIRDEVEW